MTVRQVVFYIVVWLGRGTTMSLFEIKLLGQVWHLNYFVRFMQPKHGWYGVWGESGFKQEMVQESVKMEKITSKTKKSNIKSRDKLQETVFNIQFFLS